MQQVKSLSSSPLFPWPRRSLQSALIFPPLPLTLFDRYDFITSRYFRVTCHYSLQCQFNAVFNPLLGRPSRQRKGDASYENSMFMQTVENKMQDDMDQHVTNGRGYRFLMLKLSSDLVPTDLFPPHLQELAIPFALKVYSPP